jgi:hypothetical protein
VENLSAYSILLKLVCTGFDHFTVLLAFLNLKQGTEVSTDFMFVAFFYINFTIDNCIRTCFKQVSITSKLVFCSFSSSYLRRLLTL